MSLDSKMKKFFVATGMIGAGAVLAAGSYFIGLNNGLLENKKEEVLIQKKTYLPNTAARIDNIRLDYTDRTATVFYRQDGIGGTVMVPINVYVPSDFNVKTESMK